MSIAPVSTTAIQLPVAPKPPETTLNRTIKWAAVGGVAGAALGAGLSFTALPFIGALSAPIAAAIGGAAGIVVGAVAGLIRSRVLASHQATVGAGQLPPAPPVPPTIAAPTTQTS
jgi:hypothetical protein